MSLFEVPSDPVVRVPGKRARSLRDYEWGTILPFVAIHVLAVVGLVLGAPGRVWMLAALVYVALMFGITGGYHRYFAHRTYKTGRVVQFCLAFLAQCSAQKGALWWAAHHRNHHKYSDTEHDVHSPRQTGFWYAHMGWLYDGTAATDYSKVRDLAKYPELVALNKLPLLPAVVLGAACCWTFSWPGLLVGFMLPIVLTWHATFAINSLAHVWGSRRFPTSDDSRNNLWLALVTMGEGWHNNHHHFMGSARQGFFWWEIDMTYLLLKALSWVGLVRELKQPPARVYAPQPNPAEEPPPPLREAA